MLDVDTDRVDAGSLLTARVLLTLVDISVTEPALAAGGTGAGEGPGELQAGGVVEAGGRVALGDVLLAEVALEAGQAGAVEGGLGLRALAAVLTGLGGAEALSDTAGGGGGVSGVSRSTETGGRASHHPTHRVVRTGGAHTAVLLAPRSGVSWRTGAGGRPSLTHLAGPAVTAAASLGGAELQSGLAGPPREAGPAVAEETARLV